MCDLACNAIFKLLRFVLISYSGNIHH